MRLSDILVIPIIGWAAAACSCGGSAVQPTPVVGDPIVGCPADIAVTGHNGQRPTVAFDTVAELGLPPLTVVCTPASGTSFPNGPTMVTCDATDARGRKGSCSFFVVVTLIPQLSRTKFLAFGDSVTEGKTSLRGSGIVVVPPGTFNSSVSYVEQLNTRLRVRYQDQTMTIVAGGLGGEQAGEGKLRLPGVLATHNPDALLLLEGANDLLESSTATPAGMQTAINSVVDALQNMIRQGQARGIRVFVATLLPLTKSANLAAGVVMLNDRIRSLAAQENATLVDLHAAVPASEIGADGIHPRASAYETVADEWLKAIAATLELPLP